MSFWSAARHLREKVAPVSHFTLHGVGLDYTWWGTAARGARQVLLVHGALRSAWSWEWLGPALAAALNTRVVAISRYGHGKSDAAPTLEAEARFIDEANDLLPAFRRVVSLDDVLIIGESDGAAISLIHAASGHPVAGVIALAPWVRFEQSIVQWVTTAHPRPSARHLDDEETAAFDRALWQSPEMYRWHIESFLGGVRCPVVTVQSPGDSAISVAQSQRLASGIARCEAVWLSGPTTLDPANTKTVCSLALELMREP